MSDDKKNYLSTRQFAARYGIGVAKVLKFIAEGSLPAVDVSSPGSSRARWRILPDHEAAWLESRTSSPNPGQTETSTRRRPPVPDYV